MILSAVRLSHSSWETKGWQQRNVKILRHLLKVACALVMVAIAVEGAFADTPASQVSVQTVQPTQSYPEVPANGEGWFDVGGFCKVVDVGDLSAISPAASGIPVFVPGPTDQWENYRTSAPSDSNYAGKLTLTTCCRPQADITPLCTEAGATPIEVSREYGKLGETDTVTATCLDQWGKTYQDAVGVTCSGDDGPDGQGQWVKAGPDTTGACTPDAFTSACTAQCGGGTQQTYDSCGNPQGGPTECNTQACCTPSYSYACEGSAYVRTDNSCGTGSATVGTCTLSTQTTTYSCSPSYSDSYPEGGCTYSYYQCSNLGWDQGSGDCAQTGPGCSVVHESGTDCPTPASCTYPIDRDTCTNKVWTPP